MEMTENNTSETGVENMKKFTTFFEKLLLWALEGGESPFARKGSNLRVVRSEKGGIPARNKRQKLWIRK
jgi:hypothetical protein